MKLGFTAIALAALLSSSLSLSPAALAQQQQPAVPDAPTPQAPKPLLGRERPDYPRQGRRETSQPGADFVLEPHGPAASALEQQPGRPAVRARTRSRPRRRRCPPPARALTKYLPPSILHINFVEVPVTVKDSKGKLVAGLTYRDFKVFENDTREPIAFFTTDSFPLSIAFVIDQSLTSDVMAKVNNSLGAIQGALTPYDEVAVFSYNNGARSGPASPARRAAVCPPCWP